MQLFNTRNPNQTVSLHEAVFTGLAPDGGLYLPREWKPFSPEEVSSLLKMDFLSRSIEISRYIFQDEFSTNQIDELVTNALTFPLPLVQVSENRYALELFHGPTLAFKDFGGRFLAQVMLALQKQSCRTSPTRRCTILTATSGDTGAAIAAAFHRLEGFDVRILYPQGGISPLQEKMFCTLGDNVRTFAVEGTFDDCQGLVKSCFSDHKLRDSLGLTSANSINIARLLGQIFYYFEAAARSPRPNPTIAVPSGNFGNLTAGLIAKALGAPISRFVAATNSNDTIPRFLATGVMSPNATIPTLSNAMDVSRPNNWERIESLFQHDLASVRRTLSCISIDEESTQSEIRALRRSGYLACPHTSVALRALSESTKENEIGIALATAHPAKFQGALESILNETIPLPGALQKVQRAPVLSEPLPNSTESLKRALL